ncbi:hypothetical protein [Leptospira kirschneri]|uniref:hypothetical protein n=1 Tax=Leptospira kirschneri TaxID=29507 RepID=UPI00046C667A|nr:hypothetical protein [Leptospira kirschneri]
MVVPTDYVSFYLFCDFKSYFSERNFAVVPTFKESIYKVQIQLFQNYGFLHRIQFIIERDP